MAEHDETLMAQTPALCDLQVNGGWGISFSSAELTVEQVVFLAESYARQGVAFFCPTLITAPHATLLHAARTIARACVANPLVERMVLGLHLEGPWISEREGYRGAHPAEHIHEPNLDDFLTIQSASEGRVAIVTLAPERDNGIQFISELASRGIVVALGHTAADGPTLRSAVEAGAKLATHLGNGIATPLPRHPNAIWQQAADDRLHASFIADLEHLDIDTLTVLTRAKGRERTVLVSDLSPLAGCEPGGYGPWCVTHEGSVRVAGTNYLAGAARPLIDGVFNVVEKLGWPLADAIAAASRVPLALLGVEAQRRAERADCWLEIERQPGHRPRLSDAHIRGRTKA
jgi:N-acetylglucosamine-6-phosphate deacetylase